MSNQLKSCRALLGLTQEDTAKLIGISRITYSHKEEGRKEFKISEIKKLIELFDLDATQIQSIFFTN